MELQDNMVVGSMGIKLFRAKKIQRAFMKKKILLSGLIIAGVLFSGCSVKNNFDVVLPENYKAKKQFDYKLANVNVQLASENEKTGDLDIFSTTFSSSFEQSLLKALNETKIFDGKTGENIGIKVLVLKKDAPIGGFTMEIDTDIAYTIKTHSGKVLYNKVISAQGTATVGDEFIGAKRVILANDRAIQKSIKMFIDDAQDVLQNNSLGMK